MQVLNNLSTQTPILLFPVRVQVKFSSTDTNTPVLLVRFYPDQLGIDTHDPGLSVQEIAAGQTYWKQEGEEGPRTSIHSLASWRRLVATYGSKRAAWIVDKTQPSNVADLVGGAAPSFPAVDPAQSTLQNPPLTRVMPDHFVVTLYEQVETHLAIEDELIKNQLIPNLAAPYSLETFPEPTTEFLKPIASLTTVGNPIPRPLPVGFGLGETQALPDSGLIDDRMAWMVDFDEAVDVGLAVSIPLTPQQYAKGFKRLVVLGVRTDVNETAQSSVLQEVFQVHTHTDGLALVAQGTPTNNTESQASGFGSDEQYNADATFALLTQRDDYPTASVPQGADQLDGYRLSQALGLPVSAFRSTSGAMQTDVQEAMRLNQVLWPGTYGYFLEQMMRPVFSPDAITWIRTFFEKYVLGRGPLPAFRVGNTPYGVLPTTQFSAWTVPGPATGYEQTLVQTLRQLDVTWTERLNKAGNYPAVADPTVPVPTETETLRNLLTVLSADATSVEFYQRYMLGPNLVDTMNSMAEFQGRSLWPTLKDADGEPLQRTRGQFGNVPAVNPLHQEFLRWFDPGNTFQMDELRAPAIFDQTFQQGFAKLLHSFADEPAARTGQGELIDAFAFSETEPVRPFPATTTNFITWLAESSFDSIRREDFTTLYPGQVPDEFTPPTSLLYRLLRHAVLQQYWESAAQHLELTDAQRTEPEMFNILSTGAEQAQWQKLYETTGNIGGRALHEYLRTDVLGPYLQQVSDLATLPTARLERLLAEHLDLGNHRIDAWKVGLVAQRLEQMRQDKPTGIYYGAFGWLEDVRQADTSAPGTDGIREDPDNLGYIHAPSPAQAATAAILRQGYKSRQFTTDPDDLASNRLAVNLSSERVREAVSIVEGMRGGSSLAALLGSHFEHGLTQASGQVATMSYASFIPLFRAHFPFSQEKTSLNAVSADSPVEQATRQIVDGLTLLRTATTVAYPYGIDNLPTDAGFAAAVTQEIARLQDTLDALADVAVSEGVFQATQGNVDRAAAVLESTAKGTFPVSPELIRVPRAGKVVTQRVLLHLPLVDSSTLSTWSTDPTPRALAEPGLNRWVEQFFGDPSDILIEYEYRLEGAAPPYIQASLALTSLAIQPLDVLFLLEENALRSGSTLDTLLIQAAHEAQTGSDPFATGQVVIRYGTAGALNLKRLLPLTRRVRQLVAGSRGARPEDISLPGVVPAEGWATLELTEAIAPLTQLQEEISDLLTVLTDLTAPTIPVIPLTEQQVQSIRSTLRRVALFGLPEAVAALGASPLTLAAASNAVKAALASRLTAASTILSASDIASQQVEEAAQILLGQDFRISIPFKLDDTGPATPYQQAYDREAALLSGSDATNPLAETPLRVQEWLQGVARVREPLDHLDKVFMLHDLTWGQQADYSPLSLHVTQLSAETSPTQEWWVGMEYPATYTPAADVVSLVQLRPAGYVPTGSQRAFWVDEWNETLPEVDVTTAVAFHYDQPNSEPPQTILLAVAPQHTATAWSFDTLLGTVNETLDLAKKRTIEPDALAFTHLATLLPALVAPVAHQGAVFNLDFRQVTGSAQYRDAPLLPDA